MADRLVSIITAADPALRDRPLEQEVAGRPLADLLRECAALEAFRGRCGNLYQQVRALLFLHALHRYHLPAAGLRDGGWVPYAGVELLHARAFERAIAVFLDAQREHGPCTAVSSALAQAYRQLGFQTLSDQVRRSVRSLAANRWMFQVAGADDHPLRVREELVAAPRPWLHEATPVRMDLTHSGWSDIFFLAMDYPEGARVVNVSVDLAVRGRDRAPEPPVHAWLRVIDEPVLRLESVDLGARRDVTDLAELFDFGRDYLGLLKAAVIAAGLVPPSLEGRPLALPDLLARVAGQGRGIELRSCVRGIPKGSRLAVSTTLLACLIALIQRATGQTRDLEGALQEDERRLIVARAILGEWLAGSGGGWQDSGGLWPGIKRIEGAAAGSDDPAFGVSRGRLLPRHEVLDGAEAPDAARRQLQDSLVLVHGGMAQNVGPILEMVTEKYLLRGEREWAARQDALRLYGEVLHALAQGDVRRIGEITHRNFFGPITTIIPWATNAYTERLVDAVRARFGDQFFGFWMLGGMSGGGMGFLFDPRVQPQAKDELGGLMLEVKRELEPALPFAMDPVVYDFAVNERGSCAALERSDAGARASLPAQAAAPARAQGEALDVLLERLGFDRTAHEEIRADLKAGRIGLARNRLPAWCPIEDVAPDDVIDARAPDAACIAAGAELLRRGEVAVVTLAAGAGTRWTQGAGVVKALHPFCRLAGRHRSFLEVHLAKTRRCAARFGEAPFHVVTTSHLTHEPIARALEHPSCTDLRERVLLSEGRSIGLRLIPMERDLRFHYQEIARQRLDEQAQKLRESQQAALIAWAREQGEGSDYVDNAPWQCLHPVGHFYEVPNLLLNGTLQRLLRARPGLRALLLHNVDTLGADLDPGILGLHLRRGAPLSFEVVPRWIDDRGGGLARVDGRVRLVESLALPDESLEFGLSYYNSMTTWIDVDGLLEAFGLTRAALEDPQAVAAAVRALARRLPTYITLKDVKKRWGHGQEDVFPVVQFEKLWGDVSSAVQCAFLVVDRGRGQQLKDPAQLDPWVRDGSAARVESICRFLP